MLGVSPDGLDRHGAFRTKYGLTFDLLSGREKYGHFTVNQRSYQSAENAAQRATERGADRAQY